MWIWVLIAVAAVLMLWAGHRTLDPRVERPHQEGKPRFRGSSLGLLEEIYNPGMEYVMEERASERARGSQDDSGDGDDDEASGGPA